MDDTDDLLDQARQRLEELEEEGEADDLGERVELDELDTFLGRWRGEGVMRTKERGSVDVYLLWDRDGAKRFHYRNTRLVWEIEDLKPQIGDEIAIVRGEDLEAQGDRNPTQRYAVKIRPCSDPLPGEEPKGELSAKGGQLADDEELPFLCPAGSDTRSAPAAAAATG
jgi:hypothetical protein